MKRAAILCACLALSPLAYGWTGFQMRTTAYAGLSLTGVVSAGVLDTAEQYWFRQSQVLIEQYNRATNSLEAEDLGRRHSAAAEKSDGYALAAGVSHLSVEALGVALPIEMGVALATGRMSAEAATGRTPNELWALLSATTSLVSPSIGVWFTRPWLYSTRFDRVFHVALCATASVLFLWLDGWVSVTPVFHNDKLVWLVASRAVTAVALGVGLHHENRRLEERSPVRSVEAGQPETYFWLTPAPRGLRTHFAVRF